MLRQAQRNAGPGGHGGARERRHRPAPGAVGGGRLRSINALSGNQVSKAPPAPVAAPRVQTAKPGPRPCSPPAGTPIHREPLTRGPGTNPGPAAGPRTHNSPTGPSLVAARLTSPTPTPGGDPTHQPPSPRHRRRPGIREVSVPGSSRPGTPPPASPRRPVPARGRLPLESGVASEETHRAPASTAATGGSGGDRCRGLRLSDRALRPPLANRRARPRPHEREARGCGRPHRPGGRTAARRLARLAHTWAGSAAAAAAGGAVKPWEPLPRLNRFQPLHTLPVPAGLGTEAAKPGKRKGAGWQ